MRNYITSAAPLALIAYAEASEGTGATGITEETNEKAIEPEAPTIEDPFEGFEVSEEIIGRDQDKKYGWEKYPAPAPVLDEEGKPTGRIKYAARRIPLDGVKADSVRGSLKKYQDREVTKGGPKPEFRTTIEKDDKEVPVAVFVQRIK